MLTCPYCNSPIDQVAAAALRPVCPRCGEPLPEQRIRAGTSVAGTPVPPVAPAPGSDGLEAPFPPKPREANRRTALWILGGMGIMAVVGLVYALSTQAERRERDPKKIDIPPPLAARPGDLPGLGYLPTDCNLIAGINIAGARAEKKNTEAAKLLTAPLPGWLEAGMNRIEQWTGLTVHDLDHVVMGVKLGNELPQATAVLITKEPYDLKAVERALQPARPTLHRGKPRWQVAIKPAGEALLWCPGDRVLVLIVRLDAVKTQDLEAIPLTPVADAANLPASLRSLVRNRLNQQSLVFAAGNPEHLDLAKDLWVMAGGARQSLAGWTNVRGFTLGVVPVEGLTLEGQFFTGDGKAAQDVKGMLEKIDIPGARSQRVEAPPPEVSDAAAQWVLWQVRGDADMVRGWLGETRKK